MEEFDDVITLTGDDGAEVDFQLLDIVPYEGQDYAVLLPLEDGTNAEDAEAVILLIKSSAEDEENELVGIDDEATLDAVFELFLQREAEAEKED